MILTNKDLILLVEEVERLRSENKRLRESNNNLSNIVSEYEHIEDKLYNMLNECGVDDAQIENVIYDGVDFEPSTQNNNEIIEKILMMSRFW